LAPENEPWKHLKMAICDGKLRVTNDSPYIVRLAQQGTLQPSGSPIDFPKAYVLPETKLDLKLSSTSGASTVRIHPASVYGYALNHYDVPLSTCAF
jgi:P pilus assembly chaperone PapD